MTMNCMSIYRLNELLSPSASPVISIYQPTHRHHPDNQQDPIRFRNLVTEVETSLRQKYPNREVRSLLEPLRSLAGDNEFWNHTRDGLGVFAGADDFRAYRLQRTVPELAVVADSFHLKPLLRFVQSADRYQVLCLSRGEATLHEGNRDALDPVELASASAGADEGGAGAESQPLPTVRPGGSFGGESAGRQTYTSDQQVKESHAERFFRAVDRAVLDQHSRPSGLPLVLVAVSENQDLFRRVSHNPALLSAGVTIDPAALGADQLRAEVWQVVLPHYLARLAELVDRFHAARAKHLASGDASDIAQATVAGRVGTLLVDAGRVIPGTVDAASGRVTFDEMTHPGVDDLLDDLAELVLRKGGEVVVVPAERMPTQSGAAAIFRF
jgi:hypothetical protein